MDIESYNIIRILVVVIAGLSIFYGYSLFKIVTERQGTLKVNNKETTLEMSDVGPGVYFSLFGSLVLITVLATQPTKETTTTNSDSGTTSTTREPASSTGELTSGFNFDVETACIEEAHLEHFSNGVALSGLLREKVNNAPYANVDEESSRLLRQLLDTSIGESSYADFMESSLVNTEAYNLVNSYLILYSIKNHC